MKNRQLKKIMIKNIRPDMYLLTTYIMPIITKRNKISIKSYQKVVRRVIYNDNKLRTKNDMFNISYYKINQRK